MTGSTFISVPDPKADTASLSATVLALKHNVNQLIISAKILNQKGLTGAKVFALQNEIIALQNRLTALEKQNIR